MQGTVYAGRRERCSVANISSALKECDFRGWL